MVISTTFRPLCPPAFTGVCRTQEPTYFEVLGRFPISTNTYEGRKTYRPKLYGNNNKDEICSWVQQTPETHRRIYRLKRCGNNNKDECNSPKTLIDKKCSY